MFRRRKRRGGRTDFSNDLLRGIDAEPRDLFAGLGPSCNQLRNSSLTASHNFSKLLQQANSIGINLLARFTSVRIPKRSCLTERALAFRSVLFGLIKVGPRAFESRSI
jgi:hypothetical protein